MFGLGEKNTFVGVDIGTSAIKIVEIKLNGNKPCLSNYAWMEVENLGNMNADTFESTILECLKRIFRETKISKENIYVSIPSFGGLVTLIEFPEMSKDDLDKAIRFEAHKYIPTSIDEVVVSWDIVGKKTAQNNPIVNTQESSATASTSETKIQILLVAAPRNKVVRYEKLMKDAGVELKSIEIESFSLVRSLIGNDPGNFLIVDIGSRICNIILVESGQIKINRNIDAGGRNITREIAKSMNIDENRAEKLKISGKELLNKETGMVFSVLQNVAEEGKRVIDAYSRNSNNFKIDKVILSGGTASFKGVEKYFADNFGLEISIGNPLGRIEYDKRLEPKLSKSKAQLSVCLGLALKGVEEYFVNKNKK